MPDAKPSILEYGISHPPRSDSTVRRWSVIRLLLTLVIAFSLWAAVAVGCVCVGSTGPIGWPLDPISRGIRIETVLLSSFVGACLAMAGVVYQAILRNPLADPYLLGVSTGASLCAYVWKIPLAGAFAGSILAAASQQAFAFAGAVAVVAVVLVLATRRGRLEPVTLLLVGVIMNSILGAIFLLLNALFPALTAGMGDAAMFLVGGIQTSLTRGQECAALVIALTAWIILLALSGHLNVATLHEGEAESLGVRVQRLRWIGLIVASIMTGAAVSISGAIGFVGLICPHVARKIVGSDHRQLLPWSTALGACLLCCADAFSRLLARQVFAGTQLPVGVLMALLGGPFFLVLLWERRGRNAE